MWFNLFDVLLWIIKSHVRQKMMDINNYRIKNFRFAIIQFINRLSQHVYLLIDIITIIFFSIKKKIEKKNVFT